MFPLLQCCLADDEDDDEDGSLSDGEAPSIGDLDDDDGDQKQKAKSGPTFDFPSVRPVGGVAPSTPMLAPAMVAAMPEWMQRQMAAEDAQRRQGQLADLKGQYIGAIQVKVTNNWRRPPPAEDPAIRKSESPPRRARSRSRERH